MAKLSLEDFKNFFKYYKGLPHQEAAIEELYETMNGLLFANPLWDDAGWVETYRQEVEDTWEEPKLVPAPTPTPKPWPITKEQMADIMMCDMADIPNSIMDDFAACVDLYDLNDINIAYFLGQCGHESAGLRYPVEIHSGSNYENRRDLGNIYAGDGVKYAGTGWLQVTGRYNHSRFAQYLADKGQADRNILNIGKTYTAERYPWTISGFWWQDNNMIDFCNTWPDVDEVGAKVNGRYLPNGYKARRTYTQRAFEVLGLSFPRR